MRKGLDLGVGFFYEFFQLAPIQPDSPALGTVVDLDSLLLGTLASQRYRSDKAFLPPYPKFLEVDDTSHVKMVDSMKVD